MRTIYTILLIFYFANFTYSQQNKLSIANKKYEKYAFIDAIKVYKKVVEKGYKSAELFEKLGNAYYFNGELEKAAKSYEALFNLDTDVAPEYYFRYAQCLKAIGNYDLANKYLELFANKSDDTRGKRYLQNKEYLNKISLNNPKYTIDTTSINTEFYDYGPSFFGNQIVFTSSRSDANQFNKIHDWTKQNFTDIFFATLNKENKPENVANFSKTINTKFNESSPIFTKDGKTMYFTRNNYNDGKKRKSTDKSILEKIYKAELINGEWSNIKELPFCNDNYKTAHPALSPDEKTLYFASNMPGSLGNSDLYKVAIDKNGNFGTPENLGPSINTEGRETFPFVAANNHLFFASDGHPGLGGLDVFEAKPNGNSFDNPINIGKPINSAKDDFGYIVNSNDLGFFSSNREGGLGFDDIYSFTICSHKLVGTISDDVTKEVLPNSKVVLLDNEMNIIAESVTIEDGTYQFKLECDTSYTIRVSNDSYESNEKRIHTEPVKGESKLDIHLKRTIFPIEVGTDLAKVFNISNIYFDLDKWNIRPEAAKDLEKIIAVLNEYPNMKIAIQSYTDSRQTHQYNEQLSDRRAKSTMEFIVKNGIDKSRLTAKGFGETQLVNNCADGIPCSEEDHQKNRRSEFIIVEM